MKPQRWILGVGRECNQINGKVITDLMRERELVKWYGGVCEIGKTYQYDEKNPTDTIFTVMRIFDPYNAPCYLKTFTAIEQFMEAFGAHGDYAHEFFDIIGDLINEGATAAQEFIAKEDQKK